jgi:hypothetical protein
MSFINKLPHNVKATCKCCGKESTTSPEVWFTHMKEDCDGTLNPELLEHAQAAAGKAFTAKAKQTLQHASAT